MKEFYLDIHEDFCPCSEKNKKNKTVYDDFCNYNPVRFLFFVGTKFVLVTYNPCMGYYDKYDFKKLLVSSAIKNNKIFERYEVNKSISVHNELRNFRLKNKELRKYIQQVNYLYSDNANKEYAITTKTPYMDSICNQDLIDENFEVAKNFLKEKGYDWLIDQLIELYRANIIVQDCDYEIFKTTEHIIQSINQLTK